MWYACAVKIPTWAYIGFHWVCQSWREVREYEHAHKCRVNYALNRIFAGYNCTKHNYIAPLTMAI